MYIYIYIILIYIYIYIPKKNQKTHDPGSVAMSPQPKKTKTVLVHRGGLLRLNTRSFSLGSWKSPPIYGDLGDF